jgi:hypothetical protein
MVADGRKVEAAVSGLLKMNWSVEALPALPEGKAALKDAVAAQAQASASVKAATAAGRPSLLFFVSSATAPATGRQGPQTMPTRAARESAWMNDRFFGVQPDTAQFVLGSAAFQATKVDVASLDDSKDSSALLQAVPMVVVVDGKGQVLGAMTRGGDVLAAERRLFALMAAALDNQPGQKAGAGAIELNRLQAMFGNLVTVESNLDINRSQDAYLNRFRSYAGVPQQQKLLGEVRSRMEYDSSVMKTAIQQRQQIIRQTVGQSAL